MASDTAGRLLDRAQTLVQERGYNAFSFKDLAASEGIRTASVHYHFPTKADLAVALMERYLATLQAALRDAAELPTATASLEALVHLFEESERAGLLCACGSLAADVETLPEPVRELVQRHVRATLDFTEQQIARGAARGELAPRAAARDLAAALVYGLHGALAVGRAGDRPGKKRSARASATVTRAFWSCLGIEPPS